MTHFVNDATRDHTINFVVNEWMRTPAEFRSQFPPTPDEIEKFIEDGIEDIGWSVASAGYPVALLAERGYLLSVAARSGLSVDPFEYGDES